MSEKFKALQINEYGDVLPLFISKVFRTPNLIIFGILFSIVFFYDEGKKSTVKLNETSTSVLYLFALLFVGAQFFAYIEEEDAEDE